MDDLADRRAQLAEVERELARLRVQCELAMSAFKFDECNALQRRIAALDDARQALASALPAPRPAPAPATGIVPTLARPRRRHPRR